MQIYEITKKPRVDEVVGAMAAGLAKAAANKFVRSQLPGVNAFDQDDERPSATPVQNYSSATTTTTPPPPPPAQKFPAFGTTSTTDTTTTTAPTVNYNIPAAQRKQPAQPTATVPVPGQSWQGQNINIPAVQRKQAAQAATTVTPAAQTAPAATPAPTTPAPATAPATTGVVPRAGHRIMVKVPAGGKYYKTDKGWTNEVGQAITKPASVAALEKRADASGREERIPIAKSAAPIQSRKRR